MHEFSAELKSHTSWCQIFEDLSDEPYPETVLFKTHNYFCQGHFGLDISNYGKITFKFEEDTTEEEIRNISAILLYFISLCSGFNCEYGKDVYIDDIKHENFFSFAKEDELPIKNDKHPTVLYKNIKYHDIGLNEISNKFNDVLYKLYDLKLSLTLLSNFYALVFYKDFIGNGEYLFRIVVTNIESLISLIKKDSYDTEIEEHTNFLNSLKEIIKDKENKEDFKKKGINCTNLSKHLQKIYIPLHKKLKDTFLHFEQYGLIFKLNIEKETNKIANTRNFISHNSNEDKEYLTQKERSDYTDMLRELFRMLFLEYCGVDIFLIKQKFLNSNTKNSEIIRGYLEKYFEIRN